MRPRVGADGPALPARKNPATYWRVNDVSVAAMEMKLPAGPAWTAQLEDRFAYRSKPRVFKSWSARDGATSLRFFPNAIDFVSPIARIQRLPGFAVLTNVALAYPYPALWIKIWLKMSEYVRAAYFDVETCLARVSAGVDIEKP